MTIQNFATAGLVFSLFEEAFSKQQDTALEETVEASIMLRNNGLSNIEQLVDIIGPTPRSSRDCQERVFSVFVKVKHSKAWLIELFRGTLRTSKKFCKAWDAEPIIFTLSERNSKRKKAGKKGNWTVYPYLGIERPLTVPDWLLVIARGKTWIDWKSRSAPTSNHFPHLARKVYFGQDFLPQFCFVLVLSFRSFFLTWLTIWKKRSHLKTCSTTSSNAVSFELFHGTTDILVACLYSVSWLNSMIFFSFR